MAYIYEIINDVNNKRYIGKTEFDINKRFTEHCQDAFKRQNEKRPLYSAMRKYGIEHFHVSLVEETDTPEEREMYWIEYYNSYHNGYNATLGGDGKRYLDYDLVISTYQKIGTVSGTAGFLNICEDSVSRILKENNIYIKQTKDIIVDKYGKAVNMYSLDGSFLRGFQSTNSAAKYMVENGLTGCKQSTIKQHIAEVCTGRRKTAAKFKWEYQ